MIDWHSHILPAVDDGSQSVEESIEMLDMLTEQGVSHVIATPHFLANQESVEAFLQRRRASYDALMQAVRKNHPTVLCGAEVKYYFGISKMENLKDLTIEGTNILLLEMPMIKWTEYTVKELTELAGTRGLTVILAHVERYLSLQERGTFEKLRENGLLMQTNASFYTGFFNRQKALRLLDAGIVQFIGSDCHNLTSRAPNLTPAYEFIEKKLGEHFLSQMNEFGHRALGYKSKL